MKSEERHQLLTNDLGVVTTKTVGFFEQHAGTAIAAVCGLLLAIAVGFWWTRTTDSDAAVGWTMLDSAQNPEELGSVVDKFKGKPPGQWAQLQIAERMLQSAMPLMFSNREIALTDLKHAREGFDSLLQDKAVLPAIRERALWGLALSLETGCEGDTSKPIEAFERLLADFPETMFKQVAEERIANLKKSGAAEFYAWFSKEKPQPPEARPQDFKDSVNLPAPTGGDDDADDFVPKQPVIPKTQPDNATESTPAAGSDKKEEAAKPAEDPQANAPADSPKTDQGEKPAEKK